MSDLDRVLSIVDINEKIQNLLAILDHHIQSHNINALKTIVNRILSEDVVTQVSKPGLAYLLPAMQKRLTSEEYEDLANSILVAMKQCQSSLPLDELSYQLRDQLFSFYIQCGQYSDAATTLAGVNVDSSIRPFNDEEKADLYIKCAEAYLEDDMAIEAEIFMNKASPFINSVQNWVLQLRYKATFARVQDANRKFVEAALRYYELSTLNNQNLLPEELLELLVKAITCTILSKAGVQRSRILSLICKDDRLSDLEHNPKHSVHAALVQKMFREQIIKNDEVKQLEISLADHQKAMTADGSTVLQKAIVEYNMLAVSKLYSNIYLSELASILSVDKRRAEKLACTMIAENRLKATIDQVGKELLDHNVDYSAEFDAQIANICKDVNNFVELAREMFPDTFPAL
eukprot:scaffold420_cov169-Ochromonas_danica.AAC.18